MNICNQINTIKHRTDEQLVMLYHFRTHTSLANQLARLWISNNCDSDFSAAVPITGTQFDRDQFFKALACFENSYAIRLGIQHLVSVFETFTFDVLRSILTAHPRHLARDRKIAVSQIVDAVSLDVLLRDVVDEELSLWRYKSVSDWFKHLNGIVSIGYPDDDTAAHIGEIKATRDLLAHNDGIINRIYLGRTGAKARGREGDEIMVDSDYFEESWTLIRDVAAEMSNRVLSRFQTQCGGSAL